MPRFHYEATDRLGKTVIGSMEAPSEEALRQRLAQGGYAPTLIESVGGRSGRSTTAHTNVPAGRRPGVNVPVRELANFYRQMATSVRSGVPLTQAIPRLRARARDAVMRRSLADVDAAVARGRPISEAMALHPRAFSPGHIGLVQAGEAGGFLDKAFEELATQAEADWGVEAATRFNILLFIIRWAGAPFLVAWFYLMTGLIPMMGSGLSVPSMVRLLVGAVVAGGATALLLNVVLPVLWRLVRGTPLGDVLDNISSYIPLANARRRRVDEVKALSSLSSAIAAGVPPTISWQLASEAADTPRFRRAMEAQNSLVRSGATLPEVLEATHLFDSETLDMVHSGEESGNMPEMLAQAIHYKREEARHIGNLTPWIIALAVYFILLIVGGALFVWAASHVYGGIIEKGLEM